jgi:AraC-like DNA-binding protein
MMEAGAEIKKGDASIKAIAVNSVEADLLDAVLRLVTLAHNLTSKRYLRHSSSTRSSTDCWQEAKGHALVTSSLHRREPLVASRGQ